MKPFFTIIIPTHNSGNVVGRAINSALSQSFADFEVLLMDNLSDDNTTEVAGSFKDDRIKVFSEKDTGIYDAMNKGIVQSQGEWILFLGGDDQLHGPEVLRHIHEVIQVNPSSRFIYGDVRTSNGGLQRYNDYNYRKLLSMCICQQSIFYHRKLFDEHRFDPEYKVCGDWDLNLKVFRSPNNPVYVDLPVATFNVSGISHNWTAHPEFIDKFKNKTRSILRYRGIGYLVYYYAMEFLVRVRNRLKWSYRKIFVPSNQ
jgi:glycosyltransferase involved in cell wall biosynthesis